MLENATITRIDVPATPGPGGEVTYTTGSAVSLRCAMDEVTRALRWALGEVIADANAVLWIERPVNSEFVLGRGYRLVAGMDEETARTFTVVHQRIRVKDSISHYEVFLKEV